MLPVGPFRFLATMISAMLRGGVLLARVGLSPLIPGVVVWNSKYSFSDSYANYLSRHEMGHVFGLAHASCHTGGDYGEGAYYSVMAISCPYDARDELQDHDIDDIDDIDDKY